jgi:polyhydroxyalkanoate synthase
MSNDIQLNGRQVDLAEIDMPVLQIIGEYDHLIPPQASKGFNEALDTEVTTMEFPTGHIGLSVSSKSHAELWPQVCEWFEERSAVEGEHAGDSEQAELPSEAEGEAAVEAEEGPEGVEDAATEDGEEDEENEVGEAAAESEEAAAEPTIESVNGIGPKRAERLRDSGIESLEDLADADADYVAEAIDVSPERVDDWVQQARELLDR